jgi:hypothetical protein
VGGQFSLLHVPHFGFAQQAYNAFNAVAALGLAPAGGINLTRVVCTIGHGGFNIFMSQ